MNSTFLLYSSMKKRCSECQKFSKKKFAYYILFVPLCKSPFYYHIRSIQKMFFHGKKFYNFLQVTNLLFSSMSNWLNNELKKKNDEAKKKVRHLDKNHMKDFKNVRNRICSRIDNIDKMRRKLRGNKQTEVRQKILTFSNIFF